MPAFPHACCWGGSSCRHGSNPAGITHQAEGEDTAEIQWFTSSNNWHGIWMQKIFKPNILKMWLVVVIGAWDQVMYIDFLLPLAVHIEVHHSVLQQVGLLALSGSSHTSVDTHSICTFARGKKCKLIQLSNTNWEQKHTKSHLTDILRKKR